MYHLQLTRIFMIDYNVHCVSSTSSTFQVIPHGCLNVTENIEFKQHPVPQEISEQIDKQNDELQVAKSAVLHDSNCTYTTNAAGLAELFLQLCFDVPSAIQLVTCHVAGSNSSEVAVKRRLLMMKPCY
ncbi:uncharacterized protein [Dysidea avara]|uniref:uncharacterized protein isoform X1 n=1 Tax=Dysidea avara TaxID=196820 RepID=UPI003331A6A4